MTDIVFAVIDNHRKRKGTTYNFLYRTKDVKQYLEYIQDKGLIVL